MSNDAAAASSGSGVLWNSLCLRDRLLGKAHAAALALTTEEGG